MSRLTKPKHLSEVAEDLGAPLPRSELAIDTLVLATLAHVSHIHAAPEMDAKIRLRKQLTGMKIMTFPSVMRLENAARRALPADHPGVAEDADLAIAHGLGDAELAHAIGQFDAVVSHADPARLDLSLARMALALTTSFSHRVFDADTQELSSAKSAKAGEEGRAWLERFDATNAVVGAMMNGRSPRAGLSGAYVNKAAAEAYIRAGMFADATGEDDLDLDLLAPMTTAGMTDQALINGVVGFLGYAEAAESVDEAIGALGVARSFKATLRERVMLRQMDAVIAIAAGPEADPDRVPAPEPVHQIPLDALSGGALAVEMTAAMDRICAGNGCAIDDSETATVREMTLTCARGRMDACWAHLKDWATAVEVDIASGYTRSADPDSPDPKPYGDDRPVRPVRVHHTQPRGRFPH